MIEKVHELKEKLTILILPLLLLLVNVFIRSKMCADGIFFNNRFSSSTSRRKDLSLNPILMLFNK
jgi:hypothetical protein